MTDAEIRARFERENAEMRAEDALNRRRHDEANYNKRRAEKRSHSQGRSNRAFTNPQQSSSEERHPGDETDYYTRRRRSPAPPMPSGGDSYPRVSVHPDKPSISRPCLMLCSLQAEDPGIGAATLTPTNDHRPEIDVVGSLPGSLEMTGQAIVLVNDPGRLPLLWPACSWVMQGVPNKGHESS